MTRANRIISGIGVRLVMLSEVKHPYELHGTHVKRDSSLRSE